MAHVWIGTLLLMLLSVEVRSQVEVSARIHGMGNAGAASDTYVGDMLTNPAAVVGNQRPALMVGHQYRHHQPDVSAQHILLALPFNFVHVGLIGAHFGLEAAYRYGVAGCIVGRSFGPQLAIAIGIRYRHWWIPGYVDDGRIDVDVGFQYAIAPRWRFGASLQSFPVNGDDRVGWGHRFPKGQVGMTYRFDPALEVAADLYMDREVGAGLGIGLDYAFVRESLNLRLGLSKDRVWTPCAGLGLTWKNFRFDAGASFHRPLGMSPQIDFCYVFGKS